MSGRTNYGRWLVKANDACEEVLAAKSVLITGATGSLGRALTRRLLSIRQGRPSRLILFSRDEVKQLHFRTALEREFTGDLPELRFRIGDVRDSNAVQRAVNQADIVFHTAALKQVPQCEYNPIEAVQTNVLGLINIVQAVLARGTGVEAVVAASTDKACYPANVMGMTKALQERILTAANLDAAGTRFMCARYGNVMGSRGSVIEVLEGQIRRGGPATLTDRRMTRFVVTLERAVDTLIAACCYGRAGEILIPRAPGVLITTLAEVLIGGRDIDIAEIGVRPGEKIHEVLITEEEMPRVTRRHGYYAIAPVLVELTRNRAATPLLDSPFRSDHQLLAHSELLDLLNRHRLLAAHAMAGALGAETTHPDGARLPPAWAQK
ncbi:MAG: NAD-dependent epimerase/dehydratase family protein [Alphaproteobacteria bacterium]|nr:NAD-dependent epimerase/dehydratase family protein [Alphaproteobacteria bacterium]